MVKVDKLIKSTTDSSQIKRIIKNIKHISKKERIGIRTYKVKLKGLKPSIKKKSKQLLSTTKKIKYKTASIHLQKPKKVKRYSSVVISNMAILPTSSNSNITSDNINSNKYVIAIPSYNRADTIQSKTLTVLQRHNIDPSLIHVFVANKEQYDIYKKALPQHLYGTLVIGLLGLKNQRNYINDYYPEGTHIVELDDDISSIVQLIVKNDSRGSKSKESKSRGSKSIKHKPIKFIKPIINLDAFIKHAFKICTENGSFLWGIYPIANPHFMTPTVTKDLRFIVGPMWGVINRHIKALNLTVDEKENTERTLQHWTIDGIVVRFNNVSIVTRYYKNKGGMQNEGKDRKIEAMRSAKYLHEKYPGLTKIFLGKKSGVPEVKLVKA
jgi:hypothetical protein